MPKKVKKTDDLPCGSKCGDCPYRIESRGHVEPQLKPEALYALLGTTAGYWDIIENTPFSGPMGGALQAKLSLANINRLEISLLNAVRCRPVKYMSCNVCDGEGELQTGSTVTEYEFGTIEDSNHKLSMPARGGVGGVYRQSDRWFVAGDVGYVGWGSFKIDGDNVLPTRNVMSFNTGFEFKPTTEKRSFFLFRQPYRVGFFRRPWYDETRGAAAETGFSAGFGYLFRDNNESRIDFAFEYARRGGLEENGVEETIYNMYLSIIGIEAWIGKMAEED